MRILMLSGVLGKAEAGAAGIVYNFTKELRGLGHTVKPTFFEGLLPRQNWPARFRTIEFARKIDSYVERDWNDWHSYVVEDGIASFHDARLFPSGWTSADYGPVRFIDRFFREKPTSFWEIADEVDSLVCVRRKKNVSA